MKQEVNSVIIVLGSPNNDDGSLSDIAQSRCKKALEIYQELSTRGYCAVLPTGGTGEHFNKTSTPHADYTKQYMMTLGIPESAFLSPALSQHTIEDAVLSHKNLQDFDIDTCYIVTSSFHIERAEYVFRNIYGSTQTIIMVPATVNLSVEEENRLITHEKQALAGLKKNGIIYERL